MTTPTHSAPLAEALTLPEFGLIQPKRLLALDDLFAVILDGYPVSPGHTLIAARRAVSRFAELTPIERGRLMDWVVWAQEESSRRLSPKPQGYTLGVNDGPVAGQTKPQFHFHVIPRYGGDAADPRGGIRWVIPAKARYW